ncbi:MAG TPA: RNA polymerase sigma factor [Candidatus Acidoferrum sp.]
MQASTTVETKNLAVSCLASLSASNGHFSSCDSQPADEDSPKKASAPASPTQDEKLNEAEAIRRAHNGDAAAFEFLYRLHSRRVYALCLRMVGDVTAAEDLTQDTFLLLFRKIHTFRHESAFSTWLHRLTVNLVLMHLRKKSPPTVSVEATPDPDDETDWPSIDVGVPDPLLVGSIDRVNLERCIEQLPAGYRAVFVLHDIQGYQHNEIGKMLGRSQGNSKSQLHKARMRLRELLQEDQRENARDVRVAARKSRSRPTVVAA